ncbi:MAG: YkgJ family cysteine cluster protein [Desulfobacterales bacterium]|nr:YkgJ family cysteine cluster protein [Desulfobacterales bacterium]
MATLRIFECRQCGDCCKGYGGTFVTSADIAAIARFIGTEPDSFVERYCQMSGRRPVLAQRADGYCVFWDGLCTIHPVKPRMCRAWPFIDSLRVDIHNWQIMAYACPGMRADLPDDVVAWCVKRELGPPTRNGSNHSR